MEIAFSDINLRNIFESETRLKNTFGSKVAEKIQNRLMDIRAAKNVQEVHSLGFVKFNSKLKEQIHLFKIELDKGLWIFCSINHARIPMVKSDEVNWKQVSRLKILRVGK